MANPGVWQQQLMTVGFDANRAAELDTLFRSQGLDMSNLNDLTHELLLSMGITMAGERALILRLRPTPLPSAAAAPAAGAQPSSYGPRPSDSSSTTTSKTSHYADVLPSAPTTTPIPYGAAATTPFSASVVPTYGAAPAGYAPVATYEAHALTHQRCHHHATVIAVNKCGNCGCYLCLECTQTYNASMCNTASRFGDRILCSSCYESAVRARTTRAIVFGLILAAAIVVIIVVALSQS